MICIILYGICAMIWAFGAGVKANEISHLLYDKKWDIIIMIAWIVIAFAYLGVQIMYVLAEV